MSRLHRSASAQMSRPAISIRSSGGWTFGSPSVLMMFYRAPGELAGELAEMTECMPHYYKITNGHGQGAETIMCAEAAFVQGRFTDAHIATEKALRRADRGHGQENMALCCDFLAQRLSWYAEVGRTAALPSAARNCCGTNAQLNSGTLSAFTATPCRARWNNGGFVEPPRPWSASWRGPVTICMTEKSQLRLRRLRSGWGDSVAASSWRPPVRGDALRARRTARSPSDRVGL